jgi:hypothetical protein
MTLEKFIGRTTGRTTRIINIHKINGKRPEFDVYIGRSVGNTEFTKSSKWHKNRGMSLEKYEPNIRRKIKKNPKYYDLNEIRGQRIGCWCITTDKLEPLVCHGQILMKLLKEKRLIK